MNRFHKFALMILGAFAISFTACSPGVAVKQDRSPCAATQTAVQPTEAPTAAAPETSTQEAPAQTMQATDVACSNQGTVGDSTPPAAVSASTSVRSSGEEAESTAPRESTNGYTLLLGNSSESETTELDAADGQSTTPLLPSAGSQETASSQETEMPNVTQEEVQASITTPKAPPNSPQRQEQVVQPHYQRQQQRGRYQHPGGRGVPRGSRPYEQRQGNFAANNGEYHQHHNGPQHHRGRGGYISIRQAPTHPQHFPRQYAHPQQQQNQQQQQQQQQQPRRPFPRQQGQPHYHGFGPNAAPRGGIWYKASGPAYYPQHPLPQGYFMPPQPGQVMPPPPPPPPMNNRVPYSPALMHGHPIYPMPPHVQPLQPPRPLSPEELHFLQQQHMHIHGQPPMQPPIHQQCHQHQELQNQEQQQLHQQHQQLLEQQHQQQLQHEQLQQEQLQREQLQQEQVQQEQPHQEQPKQEQMQQEQLQEGQLQQGEQQEQQQQKQQEQQQQQQPEVQQGSLNAQQPVQQHTEQQAEQQPQPQHEQPKAFNEEAYTEQQQQYVNEMNGHPAHFHTHMQHHQQPGPNMPPPTELGPHPGFPQQPAYPPFPHMQHEHQEQRFMHPPPRPFHAQQGPHWRPQPRFVNPQQQRLHQQHQEHLHRQQMNLHQQREQILHQKAQLDEQQRRLQQQQQQLSYPTDQHGRSQQPQKHWQQSKFLSEEQRQIHQQQHYLEQQLRHLQNQQEFINHQRGYHHDPEFVHQRLIYLEQQQRYLGKLQQHQQMYSGGGAAARHMVPDWVPDPSPLGFYDSTGLWIPYGMEDYHKKQLEEARGRIREEQKALNAEVSQAAARVAHSPRSSRASRYPSSRADSNASRHNNNRRRQGPLYPQPNMRYQGAVPGPNNRMNPQNSRAPCNASGVPLHIFRDDVEYARALWRRMSGKLRHQIFLMRDERRQKERQNRQPRNGRERQQAPERRQEQTEEQQQQRDPVSQQRDPVSQTSDCDEMRPVTNLGETAPGEVSHEISSSANDAADLEGLPLLNIASFQFRSPREQYGASTSSRSNPRPEAANAGNSSTALMDLYLALRSCDPRVPAESEKANDEENESVANKEEKTQFNHEDLLRRSMLRYLGEGHWTSYEEFVTSQAAALRLSENEIMHMHLVFYLDLFNQQATQHVADILREHGTECRSAISNSRKGKEGVCLQENTETNVQECTVAKQELQNRLRLLQILQERYRGLIEGRIEQLRNVILRTAQTNNSRGDNDATEKAPEDKPRKPQEGQQNHEEAPEGEGKSVEPAHGQGSDSTSETAENAADQHSETSP